MDPVFTDILERIFDKQKKDFISFSSLKKSLPASARSILHIDVKKASLKDLEAHITPYLPPGYSITKKGNVRYLLRRPLSDILVSYLKNNPDCTLNQAKKNLPFQPKVLVETINDLVERGIIRLLIVQQTKTFGIKCKVITKDVTPVSHSKEDFIQAIHTVLNGKPYVKIFELRRFLSWPAYEFDAMLQSLWNAGVIELQVSDPSLLTDDEQRDCYRDKKNTLRVLLFWRGE